MADKLLMALEKVVHFITNLWNKDLLVLAIQKDVVSRKLPLNLLDLVFIY